MEQQGLGRNLHPSPFPLPDGRETALTRRRYPLRESSRTTGPSFGPVYSGTNDEKIEQSIMAGFVSSCETAAGSVTFTALLAKPEVDLTMQLEVIR